MSAAAQTKIRGKAKKDRSDQAQPAAAPVSITPSVQALLATATRLAAQLKGSQAECEAFRAQSQPSSPEVNGGSAGDADGP